MIIKYSSKKYSNLLLQKGSIRIGTLYNFRKDEHKRGIVDLNEGKKTLTKLVRHLDHKTGTPEQLLEMRALGIDMFGGGAFVNCTFSREINSADLYVLCFSSNLSARTMAQFDGTDACAEILDIDPFLRLVTSLLNRQTNATYRGIFPVHYEDRFADWDGANWGVHPALVKEPEFSEQFEMRAIWEPHRKIKTISPLILKDKRLGRYCASREVDKTQNWLWPEPHRKTV